MRPLVDYYQSQGSRNRLEALETTGLLEDTLDVSY
jgi:hypothetical protein